MFRFKDSLERCFWAIIAFDGFGSNSLFLDEFDGGTEEVEEETPFRAIEIVHERDNGWIVEPDVTEPLTDVGPVFLFDVSIIVTVIRARTGKLDRRVPAEEVFDEMMVDELAAVVAIEAEKREWDGVFDILDLEEDAFFAFAPDGALFGPAGGDIDEVGCIDEHTGERVAAMGNGVGFKESRL